MVAGPVSDSCQYLASQCHIDVGIVPLLGHWHPPGTWFGPGDKVFGFC